MNETIVEILIDKSGSMGTMTRVPENVGDYLIDGETRMSIIKRILLENILPTIQDYTQKVFIRTFRGTAITKDNPKAEGLDIELIYEGNFIKEDIQEKINQLENPPSGGTPITAALNSSLHNLTKFPASDRKIILLTDGEENGGGDYLIAANNIKLMSGIECKIFVVGLALEGEAESKAQSISSGGYLNIKSRNIIQKDVQKVFEPLKIAVLSDSIKNLKQMLSNQHENTKELALNKNIDSTTLTIDEEYSEQIRLVSENYIYNLLCEKYGNSNVNWLNQVTESYNPYDFEIIDNNQTRFIEVKGTVKEKPTFYLTVNEWDYFLNNRDKFEIYRVFNCDDENKIGYFHIENLLENLLTKRVVPYLLSPETLKEERVFLTIRNGR
ncbi:DUF3883 domain-containing protein [Flavobacterium amniphilum]|uniref:protein NO VEIN domain-containing protein n=1 Tax=Flavobacterium amniphilum TaxID=1834035 RepID=UPI00202ABCF8|nr:DUF3883 domain-containing protein [Flavobacterium amniphilum]MCL9807463.1 DUF3883 domain-containing protein [Flavobacterium amniphilum]